ncbi:unnamed protein product [Lathyrus sativus]|nr:unnamed protein product [Lathyrus sativus]
MFPNWLDLPRDITTNILRRVGTYEIVTSVCEVCPLWWNICKDPIMWRTIHMTSLWMPPYPNYNLDLVKICCIAIERSCGHLEDIDVNSFATDDLLECIANNANNLQYMRLFFCRKISDKRFGDTVRRLPRLEKLDISHTNVSIDSLEAIGRSCPLLKSLKFSRMIFMVNECDDDVAFVIAETMSGLCHLDIEGYRFTNDGLLAIIDGCPLLESLDIIACDILDLSRCLKTRCFEEIKYLRLPIKYTY